jgi:hypothetical protein
MFRIALIAGVFTFGLSATATGQVGVAAHVGSLGLGADVGFAFSPILGVRLGANVQPWAVSATVSDVALRGVPASPALTGFVDVHPGGSGFRLTGGAVFFAGSHQLDGRPAGTVQVGGITYNASLVGSVSATLETRSLAPYVGAGWGGATRSGLGVTVDLGVALQGEPKVAVAVNGPLAFDPGFQASLDREVQAFEDDVAIFRFYPVLSVGVSLGRP